MGADMKPNIEFLFFPGCPHAEGALRLTRRVVGRLLPGREVALVAVENDGEARSRNFPGSPSVFVDGVDIEGGAVESQGLCCRYYEGGAGAPPEWMIEAGILRALRPRHILFLCVGNSARSQMAEGIARSLAPEGVRVSSAGSVPSIVRPEAIRALGEIGIDISAHRSKGLDSIDPSTVDAVITLCAEEVCPVFLGKAVRLHWGMQDPAMAGGGEEEKMAAFRGIRDELRRRLEILFRGWNG
jgi:arsenate reductase